MSEEQKKTESEPTVEQVFGISADRLEEIRKEAKQKAINTKHTWRQKGYWLVCKSCDSHHATWIQGKEMIGENEDGTPILRALK